jgi:enoyl-CoA hydratase
METGTILAASPVLVERHPPVLTLILNRPHVLNTLSLEMIRLIRQALTEAEADDHIRSVLLLGTGERAFCAGGDIKILAEWARQGAFERALQFFREEYALDLLIHRYQKPVIVFADGITMGGGLGLSAGADIVLATERTRMAMPETRIGFFPDIGATGWMFDKCPRGYPEYLALTGYEMAGNECVRLGFAAGAASSGRLKEIKEILCRSPIRRSARRKDAAQELLSILSPFMDHLFPSNPGFDAWVETHFAGKHSVPEVTDSLSRCTDQTKRCEEVFRRLAERSPTALVLTLQLLRFNERRPLEEVFSAELKAARFMIAHPDYQEGIRARILDRDDRPHWNPATLEEVPPLPLQL